MKESPFLGIEVIEAWNNNGVVEAWNNNGVIEAFIKFLINRIFYLD